MGEGGGVGWGEEKMNIDKLEQEIERGREKEKRREDKDRTIK